MLTSKIDSSRITRRTGISLKKGRMAPLIVFLPTPSIAPLLPLPLFELSPKWHLENGPFFFFKFPLHHYFIICGGGGRVFTDIWRVPPPPYIDRALGIRHCLKGTFSCLRGSSSWKCRYIVSNEDMNLESQRH